MAEKQRRALHVARLHERADVGGADGDALDLHLWDDVAAEPQLTALRLQQLGVALVLVAEVVVMTGDEVHRAIVADEHLDIVLPAHGHHRLIERGEDDIADAVDPLDQAAAILGRVDEIDGLACDDLLGRAVEGKDGGGDAQLTGALDGLAQKRPVAAVYAVEKAQGNDSMIQVLHAPKKFFRDVSVPFWARLRQRNVPSRP